MLQIDKLRPRVLIVSRTAPDPGNGSAMHLEDFLRGLKRGGCEVHYLALCAASSMNFSRTCVDTFYFPESHEVGPSGFDVAIGEWEHQAVRQACRKVRPTAVIADYSWMGGIYDEAYFRENLAVKKIIFVHDLRVRIMPSFIKMGLLTVENNTWTEAREGQLLSKADALLTLNEDDKRTAQAMAPQVRALRMGMSVAPQYVDPAAVIPGRCIYVASGNNENLFAVMWLLKYVWPRVLEAVPSASLAICGSICDALKKIVGSQNAWLGSVANLNISLVGRVDNLSAHYASAQIALVPHWMLGGVKIKHIEALTHGLAVVCTAAGADGLPEAIGRSALVAEMPPEFASQVISLLQDEKALARARAESRDLSFRLTPDAVYQEVVDYLREG
jgi:glycosyltransferase involved in cell wall biosynthesis